MPVTKNYKRWLAMLATSVITSSDYAAPFIFKNFSGGAAYVRRPACIPYNGNFIPYEVSSSNATTLYIGSGDTPATENDYTMAANIATGYLKRETTIVPQNNKCDGKVLSYGEDDNGIYAKILITGKNTDSSNIEIKEVGIGKMFNCSGNQSGGGSENTQYCLLYREVLPTPVVVAPGSTYEIIVRFNVS